MSYRNKTYVIFDGDDIHYYRLMSAWKSNEAIDFNFHDAHEVRLIRSGSGEDAVKRGLRERYQTAKQVIVLVGEKTRYQYQYVRWEIEVAQNLDLPLIVSNLNGSRAYDESKCPPIIRNYYGVHVSFQPAIIQYALDNFPAEYYQHRNDPSVGKIRVYNQSVYQGLGI